MNWYKKALVNNADDFRMMFTKSIEEICNRDLAKNPTQQVYFRRMILQTMEQSLATCPKCDFHDVWEQLSERVENFLRNPVLNG